MRVYDSPVLSDSCLSFAAVNSEGWKKDNEGYKFSDLEEDLVEKVFGEHAPRVAR